MLVCVNELWHVCAWVCVGVRAFVVMVPLLFCACVYVCMCVYVVEFTIQRNATQRDATHHTAHRMHA